MTVRTDPSGLPTDWWMIADIVVFLATAGSPTAASTWSSYVSRGQAPRPDRWFGRSPVWRPSTVRNWHRHRPRAGQD